MPKHFTRSDRVAQQVQRELAELIRTQLKDPRLGFVTITGVEVTRDYSVAKVFYTIMTGENAASHDILTRSAGYLRSELSRSIKLFKMPELRFSYDHTVENGMSLDKLINQAMQSSGSQDDDAEA